MSFDEKQNLNRWRFSKEITLGELIIVAGIVFGIANVKFTVDQHGTELRTVEARQEADEKVLGVHETRISVIEARHAQEDLNSASANNNNKNERKF
jgi:hypothetical protein